VSSGAPGCRGKPLEPNVGGRKLDKLGALWPELSAVIRMVPWMRWGGREAAPVAHGLTAAV
jgi:hypothetical protein